MAPRSFAFYNNSHCALKIIQFQDLERDYKGILISTFHVEERIASTSSPTLHLQHARTYPQIFTNFICTFGFSSRDFFFRLFILRPETTIYSNLFYFGWYTSLAVSNNIEQNRNRIPDSKDLISCTMQIFSALHRLSVNTTQHSCWFVHHQLELH